jgi:ankyrin repeat protein
MLAAYNGHTTVVRRLLERGADLTAQNAEGRTALMFAATGSFPKTVEVLLKAGADPNVTGEVEGWSALMFAAAEGRPEVVRALLDHGADPSLTDNDGDTALTFAQDNGHSEVVEVLRREGEGQ